MSGKTGKTMGKEEQIKWLVDWFYGQDAHENIVALDAHDHILEEKFIESTGVELSWSTWKSRIREAAKKMGLSSTRLYNKGGGYGAGIPRYTVIYS